MSERMIFKYTIPEGRNGYLPKGSRIIRVAMQHGSPRVWAEVFVSEVQSGVPADPADINDENRHRFDEYFIVGTGEAIPDTWEHIGSYDDGPYIWHIYRDARI